MTISIGDGGTTPPPPPSGLRESPTLRSRGKAVAEVAQGLRESPTRQSAGRTVAEEAFKIRESPTRPTRGGDAFGGGTVDLSDTAREAAASSQAEEGRRGFFDVFTELAAPGAPGRPDGGPRPPSVNQTNPPENAGKSRIGSFFDVFTELAAPGAPGRPDGGPRPAAVDQAEKGRTGEPPPPPPLPSGPRGSTTGTI